MVQQSSRPGFLVWRKKERKQKMGQREKKCPTIVGEQESFVVGGMAGQGGTNGATEPAGACPVTFFKKGGGGTGCVGGGNNGKKYRIPETQGFFQKKRNRNRMEKKGKIGNGGHGKELGLVCIAQLAGAWNGPPGGGG